MKLDRCDRTRKSGYAKRSKQTARITASESRHVIASFKTRSMDLEGYRSTKFPDIQCLTRSQEQQLNHLYIVEFLKSKTREDPKNPISSEVRRAAVKRANIGTEEPTRVSIFAHPSKSCRLLKLWSPNPKTTASASSGANGSFHDREID